MYCLGSPVASTTINTPALAIVRKRETRRTLTTGAPRLRSHYEEMAHSQRASAELENPKPVFEFI